MAAEGVGLHSQFIQNEEKKLVLKEKVLSLSGDSFSIKTAEEQEQFQVKGDTVSLSGRKHFMTADGTQLFDIRKKTFSFRPTFYCENPEGKNIFQVKSKFSLWGSKAVGSFTSPEGKSGKFLMKGKVVGSSANITDTGTGNKVAAIDRKRFSASEIFGQQTYTVTIEPGVDMALICAMCICLDEMKNEQKQTY